MNRIGQGSRRQGGQLTFSSSSYGAYHFDNLVFPCRFYECAERGSAMEWGGALD